MGNSIYSRLDEIQKRLRERRGLFIFHTLDCNYNNITMDTDQPKFVLDVEFERPLELLDMAASFLALGEQYRRFVTTNPEYKLHADSKLIITDIKTGSLHAELIELGQIVAPIINVHTVIEFSKYLGKWITFYLEKGKERLPATKKDLQDLRDIVELAARDPKATITFKGINNGVVAHTVNLSSNNAQDVRSGIDRDLVAIEQPSSKPYEKVVLYFYQTRNEVHAKTGDKGIIESISNKAVHVIFQNEEEKANILAENVNVYKYAYLIDVVVDTIEGSPALYKILRVHEKFERPKKEKNTTKKPRKRRK